MAGQALSVRSGLSASKWLRSQGSKADESLSLLIPQIHLKGAQAGSNRKRLDRLEFGYRIVAILKIVVGDSGLDMMDMMQPDAAGEPLKDSWQFVVGAARQRSGQRIPLLMPSPIPSVKLMLDIEHPYPKRTGDQQDRQLNLHVGPKADRQARHPDESHQCEIGEDDTELLNPLGSSVWDSMPNREDNHRANDEHEHRISIGSIEGPFPPGKGQELLNRQGPHITGAPSIQVAHGRVMDRMGPAPLLKRCKGENPGDIAQDPVRSLGVKEGPMDAIVEKDEDANMEPRGGNSQEQGSPIWQPFPNGDDHQPPECEVWEKRIQHLPGRL